MRTRAVFRAKYTPSMLCKTPCSVKCTMIHVSSVCYCRDCCLEDSSGSLLCDRLLSRFRSRLRDSPRCIVAHICNALRLCPRQNLSLGGDVVGLLGGIGLLILRLL